MNKLLFLFASILLVEDAFPYNILLVFPHPGKSHAVVGEGYLRHLLKAGHEVTYITAFPIEPQPRLKQVDVSSTIAPYHKGIKCIIYKCFTIRLLTPSSISTMNIYPNSLNWTISGANSGWICRKHFFIIETLAPESINETNLQVLDFKNLLAGNLIIDDIAFLYDFSFAANNRSIQHDKIQKFLMETNEKYDLAIIQWFNSELNTGYAAVFDIPYIWSSSYEHHPVILSLIDELQNPASFRNHVSAVSLPLTFGERISELWRAVTWALTIWLTRERSEIAFKEAFSPAAAKRGITLPTLEELKYKGSLVFGNGHVAIGEANKLPQNYIPIGGFHIEGKGKPLNENFQKIMDEAQNGVIYFSMGSNAKSTTMPQEMKKDLLRVFSELKQTVIWKYEEELEDKPKNVHIVQWAPQQSILAHPNCKLFISHGGLLSIIEALHFKVPVIGIPLFVDHFANMMRAVKKGYGLQIDLDYDIPVKLKVAIQEVLSNPKYREKIEEFSFIYHHRPVKPDAEINYWVEHVIKTKGAPHLQSPALHIPLYQKMYLDLLGLTILGIVVFVWIIHKLLNYLQNKALKTKNN